MPSSDFVIFINGVYGSGKSSVLEHVGDALAAAALPFALMDIDWFHRSWPPAPDDPANTLTEAKNMSVVWRNYRAAGPRRLVVSGVISDQEDLVRYETAFGLPVRSVRLTADDQCIEERLRRRYTPEQARSLDWHLTRFRALNHQLTDAGIDELVIDTSGRTPASVARLVLAHLRLGGPEMGCRDE